MILDDLSSGSDKFLAGKFEKILRQLGDSTGRKRSINSGMEQEANRYAMDMLIQPEIWASIVKIGSRSLNIYSVIKVVTNEAKKHGISPTIAAWRFKYETGVYKIPGYKSRPIR